MFLELWIEINIGENASVLNVKSVGVLLIFFLKFKWAGLWIENTCRNIMWIFDVDDW